MAIPINLAGRARWEHAGVAHAPREAQANQVSALLPALGGTMVVVKAEPLLSDHLSVKVQVLLGSSMKTSRSIFA